MTSADDIIPLVEWGRLINVAVGDRSGHYVLVAFFKNPYEETDYGTFVYDDIGYKAALKVRRELHEHLRALERLKGTR